MNWERIAGIRFSEPEIRVAVAVRSQGLITPDNVERAFPGRRVSIDKLAEINRVLTARVAAAPATTPNDFKLFRQYSSLDDVLNAVNRDIIQKGMRIECTVSEGGLQRLIRGLVEDIQKEDKLGGDQWVLAIRTDRGGTDTIFNNVQYNALTDVKIYTQMK
jgi:hypothetical protein